MDLLSLSFVTAAALVGTLVILLLTVLLIVDTLGLIRVEVAVNVWFEEKPDGGP